MEVAGGVGAYMILKTLERASIVSRFFLLNSYFFAHKRKEAKDSTDEVTDVFALRKTDTTTGGYVLRQYPFYSTYNTLVQILFLSFLWIFFTSFYWFFKGVSNTKFTATILVLYLSFFSFMVYVLVLHFKAYFKSSLVNTIIFAAAGVFSSLLLFVFDKGHIWLVFRHPFEGRGLENLSSSNSTLVKIFFSLFLCLLLPLLSRGVYAATILRQVYLSAKKSSGVLTTQMQESLKRHKWMCSASYGVMGLILLSYFSPLSKRLSAEPSAELLEKGIKLSLLAIWCFLEVVNIKNSMLFFSLRTAAPLVQLLGMERRGTHLLTLQDLKHTEMEPDHYYYVNCEKFSKKKRTGTESLVKWDDELEKACQSQKSYFVKFSDQLIVLSLFYFVCLLFWLFFFSGRVFAAYALVEETRKSVHFELLPLPVVFLERLFSQVSAFFLYSIADSALFVLSFVYLASSVVWTFMIRLSLVEQNEVGLLHSTVL